MAIHECGHAIVATALGAGAMFRLMPTRACATTSRRRQSRTIPQLAPGYLNWVMEKIEHS